ncbi:MAG TPA: GNAT family N-acetyltransferase [Acidimicrobiales bacterium]
MTTAETTPTWTCDDCGTVVEGADMDAFVAAVTDHARNDHQWPFPDVAIRNFAYASQRADGPKERLAEIGAVEVHRVEGSRVDDWLAFFDRDAFPDNFAWASCYCSEPHCLDPSAEDGPGRTWEENRSTMVELFNDGRCHGYLAYVDGKPAGWVNASLRSEYALYRRGDGADPADTDVAGISCFVIAPPYRGHKLAGRLLDRVLEDAPARGIRFVEAYPFTAEVRERAMADFRGHLAMYETRGFAEVERRERDLVVRRPIP